MKVEHLQQSNQELNVLEKAVQLCKTAGYIYRELPINDDVLERIEYLMGFKPRTVPQIFVNEQYVGGFDDLKAWHDKRVAESLG